MFLIDEVSIHLGWREEGRGERMPSLTSMPATLPHASLKNTAVLTPSTPILSYVLSYLILRYPIVGKKAHMCKVLCL